MAVADDDYVSEMVDLVRDEEKGGPLTEPSPDDSPRRAALKEALAAALDRAAASERETARLRARGGNDGAPTSDDLPLVPTGSEGLGEEGDSDPSTSPVAHGHGQRESRSSHTEARQQRDLDRIKQEREKLEAAEAKARTQHIRRTLAQLMLAVEMSPFISYVSLLMTQSNWFEKTADIVFGLIVHLGMCPVTVFVRSFRLRRCRILWD